MNNPVKVTVRIPEETKKDLEAISFFFDKSLSEIIRDAIIEYIDKYSFLICPFCRRPVVRIFFKVDRYYAVCEECDKIFPISWRR